jgi:hypothetical protein
MKLPKPPHLILLTIAIFVIGVVGWVVYVNKVVSYPLGDGLEYIGATHSGTVPFISDSAPSSSYHYATDMTPPEVVQYFSKAAVNDIGSLDANEDPSIPISFSLQAPTTNNPIYIYYYTLGKDRIDEFNLRASNKKHVIIIQDEDYEAAKSSL